MLLDDATVQTLKVTGRLPDPADGEGKPIDGELSRVFFTHQLRFDEIDVRELDASRFDGHRAYRQYERVGLRRLRIALQVAVGAVAFALFFRPDAMPGDWAMGGLLCVIGLALFLTHRVRKRHAAGNRELAKAEDKADEDEATKPIPQDFGSRRRRLLTFMGHTAMSPQFYLSVEQAKRAEGDDRLADEVFLRRRRREQEELRPLGEPGDEGFDPRGPSPGHGPMMRAWHWLVDFATGYGVRPQRIAIMFGLLWLLNWGVFLNPRSVERPLSFEVSPEVWAERREAWADGYPQGEGGANPWPADGGVPAAGEWHAGHAFFVAMRVQLPLLSLLAEGDWEPSSRPMRVFDEALGGAWGAEGGPEGVLTFENYASVMQVTNLILIPLMIAGATGVLKRRETLGS